MKALNKLLAGYLITTSIVGHLLLAGLVLYKPLLVQQVLEKAQAKLGIQLPRFGGASHITPQLSLADEINQTFPAWQPLPVSTQHSNGIRINQQTFSSLASATAALNDGDVLHLGPGVYKEPLVITANHVRIIGHGHVVFDGVSAEQKGAILTKGNDIFIRNIECRNIRVPDQNGACVRHEGTNLTLNHVYFHQSEQGVLSGQQSGTVNIENSRFERLGKQGQAHGLYIGAGELNISDSLFLAMQDQGHAVKSRAAITRIDRSILASLSGQDSRLIDVPNGGALNIRNSVLQQGPLSVNADAIGYGLEGLRYPDNQITFINNTVILERNGSNRLLHSAAGSPTAEAYDNLIISSSEQSLGGFNLFFETRQEAGLGQYPDVPAPRL